MYQRSARGRWYFRSITVTIGEHETGQSIGALVEDTENVFSLRIRERILSFYGYKWKIHEVIIYLFIRNLLGIRNKFKPHLDYVEAAETCVFSITSNRRLSWRYLVDVKIVYYYYWRWG